LAALQENIAASLSSIVGSVFYDFTQRSNYLQIRLVGFPGCHYEIILHRDKHEIALHFESSAERSQARVREFEPHLNALSELLNMSVLAGNFQSRGWTKVHIETSPQPLSSAFVNEYADLSLRFAAATFPILKEIYTSDNTIRQSTSRGTYMTNRSLYDVLDQEVGSIRAYLQGNSSLQVSDEKLCDWVNFCYILGMNAECKDLFSLISAAEVNPWYFERTKKIAKVSEQKYRLSNFRNN
jgi:hypothetical protein